jgi:hypothetical protein
MENDNRKISEILGESTPHLGLVKAAYAEASWKKISSALNAYKKYCICMRLPFELPIDRNTMSDFISWAALEKKLSPDSIKSYISNIKLIHKLKGLLTDGCSSFLCKTLIRGAENLHFYSNEKKEQKKVMSLPLLRILGHELANSNWSDHSKVVIWSTYTVAFMGSFRLGELLAKSETEFNPLETLMWRDIKFMSDDSIQIHVKVPKTRTAKGEHISLFPFPFYGCCPVAAIKKLKSLAEKNGDLDKPVFMFNSGRFSHKSKIEQNYSAPTFSSHWHRS